MPTLRVMFFGLICHVGTDPQKQQADHAVFVNAEDHEPFLVWNDNGCTREVPLCDVKGRDIYIGSLSTKPLPFSKSFQRYVVKLPDLIPSKKAVKADVKTRDEDEDVHAYLRYPMEADELTVAELYPKVGIHLTAKKLPLRRNCVARLTLTKLETHGKYVEIGYIDDDVWKVIEVVPSQGCILFSNAERPGPNGRVASMSSHHVQHYSEITRDRVAVTAEECGDCLADVGPFPGRCWWVRGYLDDLAARGLPAAETVECGNSSEP